MSSPNEAASFGNESEPNALFSIDENDTSWIFNLPEHRYKHWHPPVTEAVFISAYALVILCGVFGNGMVLYAVIRNRRMRTSRNFYIVNLAVSDLILILINCPFTILDFLYQDFVLAISVLCKFGNYIQAVNVFLSVLSIAGIALDRFHVIVRSSSSHHNASQNKNSGGGHPTYSSSTSGTFYFAVPFLSCLRASSGLIAIWLLSMVMGIPQLLVRHVESFQSQRGIVSGSGEHVYYCVETWPDYDPTHPRKKSTMAFAVSIVTVLVMYGLPIVCIIISYSLIFVKIRRHTARAARRRQLPSSLSLTDRGTSSDTAHPKLVYSVNRPQQLDIPLLDQTTPLMTATMQNGAKKSKILIQANGKKNQRSKNKKENHVTNHIDVLVESPTANSTEPHPPPSSTPLSENETELPIIIADDLPAVNEEFEEERRKRNLSLPTIVSSPLRVPHKVLQSSSSRPTHISTTSGYTGVVMAHTGAAAAAALAAARHQLDTRRQRKVASLLIAIAACFIICWLPLTMLNFLLDASVIQIDDPADIQTVMAWFPVCHLIGVSTAVWNPLLYGWLNDNFRSEFNRIAQEHFPRVAHIFSKPEETAATQQPPQQQH